MRGKRRPEYDIWSAMLQRCHNPRNAAFKDYGGRGITVCTDWRESFAAFFAHVGPRPSPAHTLDRINNDGGYAPSNVRWATRRAQALNTRRNLRLTLGADSLTITEWAQRTGVPLHTLHSRLRIGWSVDRTLTTPARRTRLTADDIRLIRHLATSGAPHANIAARLAISRKHVGAILRRHRWPDVA